MNHILIHFDPIKDLRKLDNLIAGNCDIFVANYITFCSSLL